MKEYRVTQEQLESLDRFRRMFENEAESITELCKSEKDDIVYGFELGKLHNWNRLHFSEFTELLTEIKSQNIVNNL